MPGVRGMRSRLHVSVPDSLDQDHVRILARICFRPSAKDAVSRPTSRWEMVLLLVR